MMNYTLAWVVTWTGFAMWPTHIDMTFLYAADQDLARFVRSANSDVWTAQVDGTTWTIQKDQYGSFVIDDGTAQVADLGADFWLTREHSAVFSGGAGSIVIDGHDVDWLDLSIVWVPIFIGFLTGMLFDLVFLPTYFVLRIVGRSALGIVPGK